MTLFQNDKDLPFHILVHAPPSDFHAFVGDDERSCLLATRKILLMESERAFLFVSWLNQWNPKCASFTFHFETHWTAAGQNVIPSLFSLLVFK